MHLLGAVGSSLFSLDRCFREFRLSARERCWREFPREISMGHRNPSTDSTPEKCHLCAGPLCKDLETSKWTVAPLIRDSFCMIGSAVGGTASAFYGFNNVMPVVRKWVKGPMYLQFLVGAPPVIIFSSACAGLAGGAVPALAQLVSSSCHAAVSSASLADTTKEGNIDKSRNSSPL